MRSVQLPLLLLLFTLPALAARNYADEKLPREDSSSMTSEISDPGRFGLLRLDALAADAPGDVCYMLRTYRVEREEKGSDSTRVVAEYTCQRASKFGVKRARPRELPEP